MDDIFPADPNRMPSQADSTLLASNNVEADASPLAHDAVSKPEMTGTAPEAIPHSAGPASKFTPIDPASALSSKKPLEEQISATSVTMTEFSVDGAHNTDETDDGSYSTRTRTRGARPNYAEDAEHMDFEYTQPQKRTSNPDSKVSAAINGGTPPTASSTTTSAINSKKRKSTATISQFNDGTPAATTPATANTPVSHRRNGTITSTVKRPVTNIMTFERSQAKLQDAKLIADDGSKIAVSDHVYLVCEPPGDPYYLCRVMEFLHSTSQDPSSPVTSVRVNWYYRPRDVQRSASDSRLVYGTMHSDICPLASLRGKCQILHRSQIQDLDEYRKGRDCFWFSQIFDRFIRRFYEVIPCSQIINVPEKVKKALDERWKYVAVESARVKELISAIKTCKRCAGYCASHDSVACALCQNSYHMACVKPPLPKKPTRGFGWSCGPCSRAQEKKLEARHTPQLGGANELEDDVVEEEEEDPVLATSTRAPSVEGDDGSHDQHPGTQAEIALAKMWPMRYLGIHCRVEDALQYDDRAIYPRASSRLGPRHQAAINVWHGRPVELVKPAEIKKKYIKTMSHKKDAKLSKETLDAMNKDREDRAKRPKWVLDQPPGYVQRGEDFDNDDPRNTAKLIFRMPEPAQFPTMTTKAIESYMIHARALAKTIKVAKYGTNLQDKALELLTKHKYDADAALAEIAKVHRGKDLKEPIFTTNELAKFEDGVRKYGSEHRLIKQHMETKLPVSTIIRFYYLWKKTPQGKEIWNNYDGRKGMKKQPESSSAVSTHAEVADAGDDSAFDSHKASLHKHSFRCKFCATHRSSQWRRAPGVAPGQTAHSDSEEDRTEKHLSASLLALCLRCAGLWRKYAIRWEGVDEIARKITQSSNKGYKRRIDEELLRELDIAKREAASAAAEEAVNGQAPRKKVKTSGDDSKRKAPLVKARTPTPPPIEPEKPKRRRLPCAVCKTLNCSGDFPLSCTHCFLAVHRRCYGLSEQTDPDKWLCDQCVNDKTPVVSTDNACRLCPIEYSCIDLWDHPKVSHKKKTDRDREKDRLEKQLLEKAKQEFVARQTELARPVAPREPLKKTDGNNWVHVTCAVWTPEIKFSNSSLMERAEGFRAIPLARYEAKCKLCKRHDQGACTSCHQCHANFHIACAFEAGYTFGFDVTPVKGSRKDQVTTVTLPGESGSLTAAIWCRDHTLKTMVHPMHEVVDDSGQTALQLFVENFKQADTTLTGTARRAALLSQSSRNAQQTLAQAGNAHRISTTDPVSIVPSKRHRNSIVNATAPDADDDQIKARSTGESTPVDACQPQHMCIICGTTTSPKFWAVDQSQGDQTKRKEIKDAHGQMQDSFECHRCHHRALLPPAEKITQSPRLPLCKPVWPPPLGEFPAMRESKVEDVRDLPTESREEPGNHFLSASADRPQSSTHASQLPPPRSSPSRPQGSSHQEQHQRPFVGLPPPMPSRAPQSATVNNANDRRRYQHTFRVQSSPQPSHGWSQPSLPPLSALASPPPGYPDTQQNGYATGGATATSRYSGGISERPDSSSGSHSTHGHNMHGRSTTPQDAPIIDPRLGGGASASPSLSNLLS